MPQYLFQHPKSGEVKTIFQKIKDAHEYSENGVKWNRVFTVPQAAVDTKIDCHSAKDFTEKTGKKKGSLGSIFDQAREASEKRKQQMGHDPVRKKYFKDWSAKRKGLKHPKSYEE